MKKLLALAAAGAIALATIAATAAPSHAGPGGGWQNQDWQGNDGWKKYPGKNWQGPQNFGGNWQKKHWDGNWDGPKVYGNKWKPHYGNYPYKPPFQKYVKVPKHHHHFNPAPFIFGFALGAIVSNAYAYDYGLTPHQLWCLKAYPNTYNPATNLYYIKPGVVAVCVSPYSSGFHVGYPGYPVPY